MKKDKFYYNSANSGYLAILNIKLIKRMYNDGKSREQIWKSAYKLIPSNQEMQSNIRAESNGRNTMSESNARNSRVESFTNNYNVDNDMFFKPNNQIPNDTEDSLLIPSDIELSPDDS